MKVPSILPQYIHRNTEAQHNEFKKHKEKLFLLFSQDTSHYIDPKAKAALSNIYTRFSNEQYSGIAGLLTTVFKGHQHYITEITTLLDNIPTLAEDYDIITSILSICDQVIIQNMNGHIPIKYPFPSYWKYLHQTISQLQYMHYAPTDDKESYLNQIKRLAAQCTDAFASLAADINIDYKANDKKQFLDLLPSHTNQIIALIEKQREVYNQSTNNDDHSDSYIYKVNTGQI